MIDKLAEVLSLCLAGNRDSDGGTPDYGVNVTDVSEDSRSIEFTLTFKSGRQYCCGEPGCHFAPHWEKLRSLASTQGLLLGTPMEITCNVIVEQGSRFRVNRDFGSPEVNSFQSYRQVFSEC